MLLLNAPNNATDALSQLEQAANNVTRVQIRIRIKRFWRYNLLNSVIPVGAMSGARSHGFPVRMLRTPLP